MALSGHVHRRQIRRLIPSHYTTTPMSNWKQLSPSVYHQLAFGSAYGLSDVGLVRSSNQDNFLIDPALGLVMVADGMGGHEGGEIASHDALAAVRSHLAGAPAAVQPAPVHGDPDATWQDSQMTAIQTAFAAIDFANAELYRVNRRQEHPDGNGMGTTLTGFWQRGAGTPLIVFHVGDSRLYRYRAGQLQLLTRDQTLYQQALEDGVSEDFPPRNLLLQAIGPGAAVVPQVKAVAQAAGDLYLLCSDGLHGAVPHGAIAELLAAADAQSLEQCCAALIALAKAHDSRDNISAVLLHCSEDARAG